MKIRWHRFNIYLLGTLVLAATGGCQAARDNRPKKLVSTLRLHLEVNHDETQGSEAVPVYRQRPITVHVQTVPLLTEANVDDAKVVDEVGGYVLRVRFDHQGSTLLEEYTTQNHGRRIAVFSQFGDHIKDYRWLAAPVITRRITDGVLTFTPDATRGEAEEIALGLNNVSKKVHTWIDR